MTDTEEQPRELAARAAFEHEWRAPGEPDWDDLTPSEQESYQHLADAVLAAVTPVIRRQVAEEIARDIETATGSPMWYAMVPEAAAIARSHSQHPEETNRG